MNNVLNNLIDTDAKIRVLNKCEMMFGDENYDVRYYRNNEEGFQEMMEDTNFTEKEIYDIMLLLLKTDEVEKFIIREKRFFSFISEDFINEEFTKQINQNISHPEIKEIIQEELEVLRQSITELISHIEKL